MVFHLPDAQYCLVSLKAQSLALLFSPSISMIYRNPFYIVLLNFLLMTVSRHTVVCRAAQEAGAPHREYIDRKKENVIFTLLYLGDSLSD